MTTGHNPRDSGPSGPGPDTTWQDHPEWNDDDVVLLDDAGDAIGVDAKSRVHHTATPLHLAFSCYIFDADDRILLTRRAWNKPSFPGVVTNSVCGHPRPGEPLPEAVRRRAASELGLQIDDPWLVLPHFRYHATSSTGLVEFEICPVYAARAHSPALTLDPTEVAGAAWVPWSDFTDAVRSGEREVSSWCAEQVPQLLALGPAPADWPAADPALLPPAARL
ncbi:MAG: isopentenyl-diphosphate Delta-isomerase [Actinomycetia bacterium]|nr:isopentenyl-diphosphate Delta-isomerase [Actinomycetes bacterium]